MSDTNNDEPLLWFGATYKYFGEHVHLREVVASSPNVVIENRRGDITTCDKTELTGPATIECPYCRDRYQVETDGLQIDFREHMSRCHP